MKAPVLALMLAACGPCLPVQADPLFIMEERPDAPRGGEGTFQHLWVSRVEKDPGIGVASHYDDLLTATGERLRPADPNPKGFTCSRPDRGELGQRLKVSRGLRWIICRVNDIGPNKRLNRKIDLTPAGFAALGMKPSDGLGLVRIERVP